MESLIFVYISVTRVIEILDICDIFEKIEKSRVVKKILSTDLHFFEDSENLERHLPNAPLKKL